MIEKFEKWEKSGKNGKKIYRASIEKYIIHLFIILKKYKKTRKKSLIKNRKKKTEKDRGKR